MKWEYKSIAKLFETNAEKEALFNELGKEGWECFFVDIAVERSKSYLFKRPIPEPQLAPPPIKD